MIIQYKEFSANLIYSPATKSFYGEILELEEFITFQATSHKQAVLAMHCAVDEYLQLLLVQNFVAPEV